MRLVRVSPILAVAVFAASPARAADVEVSSNTTTQFYDMRSPTGETIVSRRRFTTSLGVAAYNLWFERPLDGSLGPELSFRARMRYDADYGASSAEEDAGNYARYTPGFTRGPVDLMYGYVEGRRFFKGWLGFKLGRQYTTDALGWWSFDGASVKVTTPVFVAVEAYGGLEVRGGMPLSTPRWEREGVWRGDRSNFDPSMYPSYQPSDVAPAIGVAAESAGVSWLHGRLSYRRVLNTGEVNTSQFASGLTTPVTYNGSRVSSERLGYSIDATHADYGGFKGGLAYDMYLAKFASVFASVDAFVTRRLTLSLDYDFYQPTFDADSIWNFFASEPMNDFGIRGVYDASEKLSLSGSAHARMYNVRTSSDSNTSSPNITSQVNPNYYPSNGTPFDEGGTLGARYRSGAGIYGARATGNFGDGGDRAGGEIYGERTVETRYLFSARTSLFQWEDKLRPDRSATSFAYMAGVGYIFAPRARASFEFDHSMNRLVGQRFRGMLWLTVAVTK